MSRLCCLAACFAVVALAGPARAQDYPSRPVKAIVAVGAGGTGDIFMRVLGEELHRRWGQPVVVENRPGGASNIGARACAEAPPDGYTICIMPGEPLAYNYFSGLAVSRHNSSSRASFCRLRLHSCQRRGTISRHRAASSARHLCCPGAAPDFTEEQCGWRRI
jgi:hypothetical protein